MLEERENNLIEKQKEVQTEQMEIEEIKNQQIELLEKLLAFLKMKQKT